MVRLVWQMDEEDRGRTSGIMVRPQDYTASACDEKGEAPQDVWQAWRGRAFTPGELMGFDLANVVGVPCMVSIVHASGRKGGTFANVAS